MTADEVCAFLALLDKHRVDVWLDGGWAVDASLGSQTRRHDDVDIVIEERDVPAAVSALKDAGYAPVPRPDTRAWNFVMGDNAGRLVDFHVIVLDRHERGIYGPPENNEFYPAEALAGTGTVGGRAVKCITPAWLVRFHTGYEQTRPIGRMYQPCASGSASRFPTSTRDSEGALPRDDHRRPPLAPLAPHQPRPARDAAHTLERGGMVVVRVEFRKALAVRSQIRRAGFNYPSSTRQRRRRGDRIWMTCSCGAVLVRVVAFG
jgi:lincosamide nucleotidyltransferase A/C/D/E